LKGGRGYFVLGSSGRMFTFSSPVKSAPRTGVKAVVRQIAPIPVMAERLVIVFLFSIALIFRFLNKLKVAKQVMAILQDYILDLYNMPESN
jgi:hypothetical protein